MSCVLRLFGLCMYALRATGGGGLEDKEEDWRQDLLGGLGFPGLVFSRKHRKDTYRYRLRR